MDPGRGTLVRRLQERERAGTSVSAMQRLVSGHRMDTSQSLFKRDLMGHFGCVNAIEFSTDSQLIASGGDDRRLLIWNVNQTLFDGRSPQVVDTLHSSNINTCCFDADNLNVSTGGNDGQVIVHDLSVLQSSAVVGLSEAVYCLSPDPVNAKILATATDDGKAQILDLRLPVDSTPFVLANQTSAMHSVMYNPAEPRLVATANSKHGVAIWDVRMPLRCLHFKSRVQNCMSARFNNRGDQLLVLQRRATPVLFDIGKTQPLFEFDYSTYYNACTLKSCSFAGLNDEFVMAGSDDFCIYLWKIPDYNSQHYVQTHPHMILKGHRSIVNQVRFSRDNQMIISSGVEKLIKIWSPYYIPGSRGGLIHSRRYGDDDEVERNAYSHEEYIHMVLQAGSFLSHDYTNGSTEEEPCMIAFFDSLIQRETEQDNQQDDVSDSSSEAANGWAASSSSEGEGHSWSRPAPEESSSDDSEGEVDQILSAMYNRYMSARHRASNSHLTPSGSKISAVIAKSKQKEQRNHYRSQTTLRTFEKLQDSVQQNSRGRVIEDRSAGIGGLLSNVVDSFLENLMSRNDSNSRNLSDTNDGHLTDSNSNSVRERSSTPVEVIQETLTLHTRPGAGPSRQLSRTSNSVSTLQPGMYFMPELRAFDPGSFNAVLAVGPSTAPADETAGTSGSSRTGSLQTDSHWWTPRSASASQHRFRKSQSTSASQNTLPKKQVLPVQDSSSKRRQSQTSRRHSSSSSKRRQVQTSRRHSSSSSSPDSSTDHHHQQVEQQASLHPVKSSTSQLSQHHKSHPNGASHTHSTSRSYADSKNHSTQTQSSAGQHTNQVPESCKQRPQLSVPSRCSQNLLLASSSSPSSACNVASSTTCASTEQNEQRVLTSQTQRDQSQPGLTAHNQTPIIFKKANTRGRRFRVPGTVTRSSSEDDL